MRISGVGELGKLDLTNNKYTCDNMPEEYIKITCNEGISDMSKCYWNADDVTEEGFICDENSMLTDNCKVIEETCFSDSNQMSS